MYAQVHPDSSRQPVRFRRRGFLHGLAESDGPTQCGGPAQRRRRLAAFLTALTAGLAVATLATGELAAGARAAGELAAGELAAGEPTPLQELARLERAFEAVTRQVAPSVVSIRALRRTTPNETSDATELAGRVDVAVNGTGVVYAANGLIATNEHVIQRAERIEVGFFDGRILSATVVAADARSDLAILRVARIGLTPAVLADWRGVQRGQWSVVLGNPFGVGNDGRLSVSVGVVSNLGRQLPGLGEDEDRLYTDMIQTTARIHPGNSGGPLFNLSGELIGIVTAMHTRPEAEGMAFALPLTPAKRRVLEQLARGEPIEYGYLGVSVRLPEPAERSRHGLPAATGVVVESIDPEGPAASLIQPGDVILSFDDQIVAGPKHLVELTSALPAGRQAPALLRRGAASRQVTLTVARRDAGRVAALRQSADRQGGN